MVGVIDGNRMIEMASTDFTGMCGPRTWIEYRERGGDAARETVIREVAGGICNVFLAGWLSLAMLGMLGNSVNRYNPHGLPGKAWISARSLEAFGGLYQNILTDTAHPVKDLSEARERFIKQVLTGLISADQASSRVSLPQSARELEPQAQVKYLRELVKDALPGEAFEKLSADIQADSLEKQAEKLTEALHQANNGKLTREAQERLYRYFSLKAGSDVVGVQGTNHFNRLAMAQVLEEKAYLEEEARRLNQPVTDALKHFDEVKEFKAARLRLSLADLDGTEREFLKQVSGIAQSGKLTSAVHLYGPDNRLLLKTGLLKDTGRDALFGELKHFLEQFVDRAGHGIDEKAADWKQQVLQTLNRPSEKRGLWSRLMPQADEGLLRSALKTKTAYTWIPMLGAALVGMSVGFFNNWLTKKRNGGKVSYPGDGPPTASATSAPVNSQAPNGLVSSAGVGSGLKRSRGAFAQFQAQRFGNGGILA
ncbi:MAG TPA: hypothetical protein V6C52_05105 [Coleofasciculaceae cyanobacterium]